MDDGKIKVVQLSLREFTVEILPSLQRELVDARFPPGGSKMAGLTEALADMVEHYVVRGWDNGRVEHPEVQLAHEFVSGYLTRFGLRVWGSGRVVVLMLMRVTRHIS